MLKWQITKDGKPVETFEGDIMAALNRVGTLQSEANGSYGVAPYVVSGAASAEPAVAPSIKPASSH